MTQDVEDDFRDLAYLAHADVKLGLNEDEMVQQWSLGLIQARRGESLTASLAESAILRRDSTLDTPPPLPPKDSIYLVQKAAKGDKDGRGYGTQDRQKQSHALSEDEHREASPRGRSMDPSSSEQDRRTSSSSSRTAAIPIGITTSNLDRSPSWTVMFAMDTLHPLAMSPSTMMATPKPDVDSLPRPMRPVRSLSSRLSSFTRDGLLTSSKIIVIDSRPSTSRSQTQSAYTSTQAGLDTMRGHGSSIIKYGRGRHSTTELVPQPSDDDRDPLNWPTWKKELNLYALLVTVALVNAMKTALISVEEVLAQQYSVSYTAVAALTGVPLILSAISGLAASTTARLWGRRPVYLGSMVLLFIGLVWNTQVGSSYAQFMLARMCQGFGWGAFDTLVVGSIMDAFFEHERYTKVAIYRTVSVAMLWGAPLIGGIVSQSSSRGFALQFEIMAVFQIVSVPLLLLAAPETMFDGSKAMLQMSSTAASLSRVGLQGSNGNGRFRPGAQYNRAFPPSKDQVLKYIRTVARPMSYYGPVEGRIDRRTLLQAPRAAVAPTTVMAFLASFLPHGVLWGFTMSLSGLVGPDVSKLSPGAVGTLLLAPFILSTAVTVACDTVWPSLSQTSASRSTARHWHLYTLATGSALSLAGMLGFSLSVAGATTSRARLAALSIVLGLMAAGTHVLDGPTQSLVRRSAQFTSPNLAVSLRNESDMRAGVAVWQALAAGVFSVAVPAAVAGSPGGVVARGLISTGVGAGMVHLIVAAGLGVVRWSRDENIWRLDGQVLRCVDLTFLKAKGPGGPGSFFEAD